MANRQKITKSSVWVIARRQTRVRHNWDTKKDETETYHDYPEKSRWGGGRLRFKNYVDLNSRNSGEEYVYSSKELGEQGLKLFKQTFKHHSSKVELIKLDVYSGIHYDLDERDGKPFINESTTFSFNKKDFVTLDRFLKSELRNATIDFNHTTKELANATQVLNFVKSEVSKINFNHDLKDIINEDN